MNAKLLILLLALATAISGFAAIHYVDLNSPNPTPPYTNWATAATAIQDAVDTATNGDEVVVTNGIYVTGGRAMGTNGVLNRVTVDKKLTLHSVNGPAVTIVEGYNGGLVTRCVYLSGGSSLSGFTLRNANVFDGPGGGVMCDTSTSTVSNCVIANNMNWDGPGGGVAGGTLNNCVLSGNWTLDGGGGAYGSTLINCTVSNNYAQGRFGGGVWNCMLDNCTLISNRVGSLFSGGNGGAAAYSTLDHCTLTGNSSYAESCGDYCARFGDGGGSYDSVLNHCTLTRNVAEHSGGGAARCYLGNCSLVGNSAGTWLGSGGGAAGCTLNNCTLAENSAPIGGGVASFYHYDAVTDSWTNQESIANNCIAYFNTASAGANCDANVMLNNCCTTPLPTNGFGNITNAPLFMDFAGGNLRLQSNSPCINAGNNAYAPSGSDLDGNPRIVGGTVDIGAYEFQTPTPIELFISQPASGFVTLTWSATNMVLVRSLSPGCAAWIVVPSNSPVTLPTSADTMFFRLVALPLVAPSASDLNGCRIGCVACCENYVTAYLLNPEEAGFGEAGECTGIGVALGSCVSAAQRELLAWLSVQWYGP